MRILWLDQTEAPWKQADGWDYLSSYDFDFVRVADPRAARLELKRDPSIHLAVINADIPGALDWLGEIRERKDAERISVILVSAQWGKKDFKAHSISPAAADNYARLPMPAPGFIDVVVSLTGMSREDLLRSSPGDAAPIRLSNEPVALGDDPSALLLSDSPPPIKGRGPAKTEVPKSPLQAIRAAISAPWRKEDGAASEPTVDLGKGSPPLNATADVLKKYLELREAELERALREKAQLERMADELEKEREALEHRYREIENAKQDADAKVERLEKKVADQERHWSDWKEKNSSERESLQDRVRGLEEQVVDAKTRYSSLKDRVRRDIRKIQAREKELETRLELVKRDSESLLSERDRQVLELKRKIDALEFDLDLIQDRKIQAENDASRYVAKLSRVARTLELAVGMLAENVEDQDEEAANQPVTGGAAENFRRDEVASIDHLLKKPGEELNTTELAAAEAPTRIFKKEQDADQLLAGIGEEQGESGDEGAGNDFDTALGS